MRKMSKKIALIGTLLIIAILLLAGCDSKTNSSPDNNIKQQVGQSHGIDRGATNPSNNIKLGQDLQGGLHVVLQAQEEEGMTINTYRIEKSIGILKSRLNSLGVRKRTIYAQGKDRIVIELAGVKDPEAAVNIIKNTAQLEFWDQNGKVLLTGEYLKDAKATANQGGQGAEVNIEFDKEGTKLFAKATQANIGKPISIVIDKKIISSPTVQEAITGGTAVITGNFTAEEAEDLAVLLRSGALPLSFKIIEERTIGSN